MVSADNIIIGADGTVVGTDGAIAGTDMEIAGSGKITGNGKIAGSGSIKARADDAAAKADSVTYAADSGYNISVRGCDLYYGDFHALKDVSMEIVEREVTALIGPSGCGKSTFIKLFNRMNDLVDDCRITGEITIGGMDIYAKDTDVNLLRKNAGMVFQKPNPFPVSLYDNVAFAPRTFGINKKAELDGIVERSLRQAGLWGEVKDRLRKNAMGLSGGQQQRLCIARALAAEPRILLMDEPTSALDPISTSTIEDLISELKAEYTIVIVTHNMQQATRVSDKTAFFLLGEIVESGATEDIFSIPKDRRTENYITGRFG